VVDRNGVVCETEDTIEFTESKCESWLFGGFSKVLVLDCKIADGDGILRDVSLERT
jgi:hypothetical protein